MSIGPENYAWVNDVIALRRDMLGLPQKLAHQAEEQAAEDTGAYDAGERCNVCGDPVTWADHLPGTAAHPSVRCFAGNVTYLDDVRAARRPDAPTPPSAGSVRYPFRTRGGH